MPSRWIAIALSLCLAPYLCLAEGSTSSGGDHPVAIERFHCEGSADGHDYLLVIGNGGMGSHEFPAALYERKGEVASPLFRPVKPVSEYAMVSPLEIRIVYWVKEGEQSFHLYIQPEKKQLGGSLATYPASLDATLGDRTIHAQLRCVPSLVLPR